MTISNPPLPSESLVPAATAPAADAVAAPGGGFDQFMAAGTPAAADESPDAAPDAPATEQAAVLAASILWAPMPLLVETPPPALPEMMAGAATAPMSPVEAGEEILPGTTLPTNQVLVQPGDTGAAEFRAPKASELPEAPSGGPEVNHPLDDKSPGRATVGAGPKGARELSVENPAAQPAVAPAPAPDATFEAAAAAIEPEMTSPVSFQADRPAPRRPLRGSERAEKIADMPATPAGRLPMEQVEAAKTFVSSTQQTGRVEDGIVGTSSAKSGSEMPYALADHPSAAAALVSAPATPDGQHQQFDLTAHVEPEAQVRDAVATVMSVIDAQEKPESATNRTVNLDFDFGGERLAVRVEFRDGAVRAHFRTQSLELRSALASEWSHLAAAPENILRAVEPVFVTSSRSEQSASFHADGGASRQQQQQQPASESPSRATVIGFRPATAAAAAPVTGTDESLRYRRPYTTRHLHAIA